MLRAAGLPEDLFGGAQVLLTAEQLYRCWTALEELVGDPAIGATLAARISTETFQAPVFAALCSPNLRRAAERIATSKRLLGPQRLLVDDDGDQLRITMQWPRHPAPPPSFVAYEVAFVAALARLGTRTRVTPLRVAVPDPPIGAAAETYADYLIELLPAGDSSAGGVARRLALSGRTLQRRLAQEGTTFQTVLESTRLALARHYLNRHDVTVTEIAFLLGYDEPSSFNRAFRQWSGTTPQQARADSLG